MLRISFIFVADGAKTELRLRVRAFYAETGKKPRICSKWSPWSAGFGLPMKPTYAKTRAQIHRYYECPNHINRDKGCPTRNLPAEAIEMAVASNLASLAGNPAMMHMLQEHLPQLAHRDISVALSNVEQLVEYIPDDALATLFQALNKEVSYNAAAQELDIVKYSS